MLQRVIITTGTVLLSLLGMGQVSFQSNTTAGCTPLGVVIQVTSPAAGTISSYAWTITRPDGSTHSASSAQYLAVFTQPGSYTVSLTVNGNQSQTVANYIQVFANPVASFVVNDAIGCFPHQVQFTSTSLPGSGAITNFNWDFGNGSTGNGSTSSNTYAQVGNYTPVLSIQDENGCIASVANPGMVSVINSFPTVQFTTSPTVTCPAPAVVTFNNTSSGNGPLSGQWTFGDSSGQPQNGTGSLTHTYNSSGVHQACLTVTDVNGCVASLCKNVNILNQANPSFNVNNTTVCAGSPVSFTNTTGPTATSYSWDFNGDGTSDSFNASPTYVFSAPGTYTPSLTATYSPTCSGTFTGPTINVVPGLVANFTANQTTSCEIPFQVTFTNTSFGSGISSNWFVNGQNVGSGSPFNYTFTDYGNYNVTLMTANSSGCSAQSTQNNMIVVQSPSISFSHPTYLCAGEPFSIIQPTVNSASPVSTWSWDFDGDMIVDATGTSPEWTYEIPGVYHVTGFVLTESGCVASWTSPTEVNVLDSALPTFAANTTVSCAGEAIEFCIPEPTENQYSWDFGDGSGWITMESGELCIVHDYQDTGYFSVTLTVFNQACNATLTFDDYIYITPPVAKFDFGMNCDDLLTVQFGDLSIEADQILWDFGDGSPVVADNLTPTHTFPGPGSYTITQTAINDVLGCPDHATATIHLVPPSAAMTFQNTTDCPPALVQINTTVQSAHWTITISNGDELLVDWNPNISRWQVYYTHNGTVTYSEFTANQNFWPLLIFEQAGCYDIDVHTEDAFGCTAEASYPNAVCVPLGSDFANFTWTPVELCSAVTYAFTSTSPNLVSWDWSFNNTGESNEASPTYSFPAPYVYGQPLTVTLTGTDSDGCVSVVTHSISPDFPVVPTFVPSAGTVCANAPITFTNTTPGQATSYSWNFGDPQSGVSNTSSALSPTHSFSQNGTYTVCLSATNASGCVRTTCQPASVTVNSPVASFTHSSQFNSCLFSVSFTNTSTGASNNVVWNFGDGQTGNGNLVYHTYPLGVFDVSLTVTNSMGCVSTALAEDIFNYSDVIGPFSVEQEDSFCAPLDIELTAYNPTDTYFTYFWDFNDGNGDPSGSTVSNHTYLEPGVYCPQLIMTDPNGCNVLVACEEPIVVEQFQLHYAMDQEICAGESISVTISNGENYTWSAGSPVTAGSGAGDFILQPSSSATYTLTGNHGDCVDVQVIDVIVHSLPSVSLSFQEVFCAGENAVVLSGGLPEILSGVYLLDGVPATQFDPSLPPGNYTLTYEVTGSNECSNATSQQVEIRALPQVTLTVPASFCDNQPVHALTGGIPVGGTYSVSGETAISFDPAVGPGTYAVSYLYADSFGCSGQANQNVQVYATPDVSVSIPSLCLNEEVEVVNSSSIVSGSIASVEWTIAGAAYSGTEPEVVHPGAVGQYGYNVTMASNQGCSASSAGTFTIWALPVAAFTYDVACENQPTVFTATGNVTTGLGAYYAWDVNGTDAGNTMQTEFVFTDFETASMTLTVTSSEGCSSSVTQAIVVRPAPVVNVSWGPACDGSEIHFSGTTEIAYGGVTGLQWNFGDGIPVESGPAADHLFDGAGTFPIVLSATSNFGCETIVPQWVTVYPNPEVSFVTDVEVACANVPVGLLDLSSVADPSDIIGYTWYFDQTLVSTQSSDHVLAPGPGMYDVRLVVTTNAGCIGEAVQLNALQVYPVPTAGFSVVNNEVTMGDPRIQIVNESSADVTGWNYDFGDGHSAQFSSGLHTYSTWNSYDILQVVHNTFGCSDSTQRTVIVNPEAMVYIPNAFTPDGNGHNEIFQPVMSGFDPAYYTFSIFDRWGRIVFETNDLLTGWNGQYQNSGQMSPDGAYTWTMEYRTATNPVLQHKDGLVILLR